VEVENSNNCEVKEKKNVRVLFSFFFLLPQSCCPCCCCCCWMLQQLCKISHEINQPQAEVEEEEAKAAA